MSNCCAHAGCELEKLRTRQSLTLKAVLLINLGMFLVELLSGLWAGSTALVGDSLDMLGDALICGFSLYIVARNDAWKAVSAMIKGAVMGLSGLLVLAYGGYKFLHQEVPPFQTIGQISLLALTANSLCLALLWRHRREDINMKSVWLCSRNDMIANLAVLAAALGVWLDRASWPDLVVGIGIAMLFLRAAFCTVREAIHIYKSHQNADAECLEASPIIGSSSE
jgi:Co/Zn/Cd efflux system component